MMIMLLTTNKICGFERVSSKSSSKQKLVERTTKSADPTNTPEEEASGVRGRGSHCWQLAIGVSRINGSQKGRRNKNHFTVNSNRLSFVIFHDGKSAETCLQALTSTESNSFCTHYL
jgi:hypothetical protein